MARRRASGCSSSSTMARFHLRSLALIWSSFFGTILLRAAVTMSATTNSPTITHAVVESVENPNVQVRLSLRRDTLDRVPSCQHTFSQVEVTNLVRLEKMVWCWIQASNFSKDGNIARDLAVALCVSAWCY